MYQQNINTDVSFSLSTQSGHDTIILSTRPFSTVFNVVFIQKFVSENLFKKRSSTISANKIVKNIVFI